MLNRVPLAASLVDQAVSDLAARLNIDKETITIVTFESVIWPDGSLGCPRPGLAYKQVLVEGARIRLEAQGRRYAYHCGPRRPPFLCENPSPPLTYPNGRE